jgi:hypothetical protein
MNAERHSLTATEFAETDFNRTAGEVVVMGVAQHDVNLSLWKAGNALAAKSDSWLQVSDAYNASVHGDLHALHQQVDLRWIITNTPKVSRSAGICSGPWLAVRLLPSSNIV